MVNIEVKSVEDIFVVEVVGNLANDQEVNSLRAALDFLMDQRDVKKMVVSIVGVLVICMHFLYELERTEAKMQAKGGEIILIDNVPKSLEHCLFHTSIKVPIFHDRRKAITHFLLTE